MHRRNAGLTGALPAVSSPEEPIVQTVASLRPESNVASSSTQRSRRRTDHDAVLVEHYRELVQRIAGQVHRRSPPSVQRDDLVAAGMSGLWDALRRRSERPEESFDYYVCRRVRGAIIDELRAEDWLPRRRGGETNSVPPGGAPVAVVHYDDLGVRDRCRVQLGGESDSEDLVGRKRAVERVREGLERLPPRERYVLIMRDLDEVPIKELGEELGVSKPRVCQIRTQALRRLRGYLDDAA
ncbi:MAG: sigma-70 family RNA polymerase sigma factor [Polyangiaceae bacterium]|nr:sigma-70 family RNA polymerase sigma factor [Polyangiaceae bacterium]